MMHQGFREAHLSPVSRLLAPTLTGLLLVSPAKAGEMSGPAAALELSLHLVEASGAPSVLDGSLDEDHWQRAPDVTELVQLLPREGAPASLPTRVWLARHGDDLLIALRAEDPRPDLLRARRARRDAIEEDDRVGLRLDPVGDGRRAYEILFNAHGVVADGTVDAGGALDLGVDLPVRTAASRDARGFTVEASVPLAAFLGRGRRATWGLQVLRVVPRLNEVAAWPEQSAGEAGKLVRAGRLQVGELVGTRRNWQVSPHVLVATDGTQRAGLDLSWRPNPAWRAELTLNPDFSQVEADVDQVDVNSRFALFFPEKRAFFLEGVELWELPFSLVHTRTMVEPRWGLRATRAGRRHSVSALVVDDGDPSAAIGRARPEPEEALTGLVRWRGGLGGQDGFLGALATWRDSERGENLVLSFDGRHRPGPRQALRWQLAGSRDRGAVDAEDWAGRVEWSAGDRLWAASSWAGRIGAGFSSDLGFVPRVGFREIGAFGQRRIEPARARLLEALTPSLTVTDVRGPSGERQDLTASAALRLQFQRATSLELRHVQQDLALAGERLRSRAWRLEASTFAWARLSFGLSLGFGRGIFFGDPSVGDQADVTGFLNWSPTSSLRLEWSATRTRHERDDDTEAFDLRLRRFKLEWQWTRAWRLRLVADDRTDFAQLDLDLLVAWEPSPGRVLYLGLDRRSASTLPDEETAFLKLGWRWPADG